ncbi:MAG: Lrp/AsnC family transcriptional regulator [Archaeoglobaceae archaeon]|nr:Lrp/AsnC family transcriptional regulator [Archaeoglobaceae archaeon]MDW8014180.1 Lrp/AsnC family transcriptional regulator [Archaeoglobaceae archaeon]
MDEKDKEILELLEKNPEKSQSEIAKAVGLSQPSVGARIKKLKDLEIIDHVYGINLKKVKFYLIKVDLKCTNPKEMLKKFSECPYFLNGFVVVGEKNLTLLFISEDLATLESILDKQIRLNPNVQSVEAGIVVRAEKDIVTPMKIKVEKGKVPCENGNCSSCDFWNLNLCLGCPITGYYRGKIW